MEVEAEILAYEPVLECAVIPVDAADAEQEVMAVIVPKPGMTIDPAALIAFLSPRMAHFMVPRYVSVIADMPKTPTGKIQKFVLREAGVTAGTWDREAAGIRVSR
jgi:crotonobetaine/carnitine-CoA ligase